MKGMERLLSVDEVGEVLGISVRIPRRLGTRSPASGPARPSANLRLTEPAWSRQFLQAAGVDASEADRQRLVIQATGTR
jgi:hypothetical protein